MKPAPLLVTYSSVLTNILMERNYAYCWYGSQGKRAQGEATRAALLEAGRGLFGAQGYSATSTEELVARAGVTKAACTTTSPTS